MSRHFKEVTENLLDINTNADSNFQIYLSISKYMLDTSTLVSYKKSVS